MYVDHMQLKKKIIKSQHCQRNWDLDKTIPNEDLDLLVHAATQCPSKQNVAFYNLFVITDRKIIEGIHEHTYRGGFAGHGLVSNPQVLANSLFVFTENKGYGELNKKLVAGDTDEILAKDRNIAVGIAAGYLNLISSLLGYSTGCCTCFDSREIKKILNIESRILLLMGIGYNNTNKNRRIHHTVEDFVFPTIPKEPIQVTFLS